MNQCFAPAAFLLILGSAPVFAQQPQPQKVLRSLIETYKATFHDDSWPSTAPLEHALSYDPESDAPKPRFRIAFPDEAKSFSLGYVFFDRDHDLVGEVVFGKGFYAESVISNNRFKLFRNFPGKDFLAGWLGKQRETEEAKEETNGRLVIMAGLLRRLNELGEPGNLARYHHCVFESDDVGVDDRESCALFLWNLVFDATKTMRMAGSLEMLNVCRKKKCKRKEVLKLMPESMSGAIKEFGEEKGLRFYVFCRLKKEFPDFTSYFPYWEKRR